MLWFKFTTRRLLPLGLCLLSSGCFQPLYAPSTGRNLRTELASISVAPIPDRLGHYLETALKFALDGGAPEIAPKYKLTISVRERVQTPLIDTISGRASAATVMIDADYNLKRISDGESIGSGIAFTAATYDRSSQRYANIRAARDAEIRDAQSLADQIRTRVAVTLANQS